MDRVRKLLLQSSTVKPQASAGSHHGTSALSSRQGAPRSPVTHGRLPAARQPRTRQEGQSHSGSSFTLNPALPGRLRRNKSSRCPDAPWFSATLCLRGYFFHSFPLTRLRLTYETPLRVLFGGDGLSEGFQGPRRRRHSQTRDRSASQFMRQHLP
jgi:hypothetical protein